MSEYLDFKPARCKDCYKCLRECPVKAIQVINHQAAIIDDRCILCGHCTLVCPQNAKFVHSELDKIKQMLEGPQKVIASVAPSFISSMQIQDFSIMKIALAKIGFYDAEETAVGANVVTQEYQKLMMTGNFKNFITSACPAVCQLIQIYYPKALKYLAPVDSPMIAHSKMLRAQNPEAKIVFIGPCIAKKREGQESSAIDGVLTFEELILLFEEKNIDLQNIATLEVSKKEQGVNLAKSYPISHGIIKSFATLLDNYEYMAVDGADRCVEVLENIETISGVFLEMNSCKDGCINGPCAILPRGGSIKATSDIREYVSKEKMNAKSYAISLPEKVSIEVAYPRMRNHSLPASDHEIEEILHKTGKFKPEDELNCGGCGYNTCREKAWAVLNGYADIEICLPYMRERAESMSYEIIHNHPDGILVIDEAMNIMDINSKAKQLLGIIEDHIKGRPILDFYNPTDFLVAFNEKKNKVLNRVHIPATDSYVNLSLNILKGNNVLFAIMKDVTQMVNYNDKLSSVKMETLKITDAVIQKQMRVAQEIASLLGETTAETKVALVKLKKTLQEEEKGVE